MRVIADHLRAMTFLIADGVVPSNEWRGYVLRKIMRRAMRHGKKLGFAEPVLHTSSTSSSREMGDAYPELRASRDAIVRVVRSEEERFDAVLTAGLPRLEEVLDRAAAGERVVPGDEAFRLYDSLGVPLDFMEDLAGQRQIAIDREGFERAMEGQRDKARAGSAFKGGEKALALTHDAGRSSGARRRPAISSRATTRPPCRARRSWRSSTRPATVDELPAGGDGLRRARRGRRSTSKRAARCRTAAGLLGADGSKRVVERLVRQQPDRPRLHLVARRRAGTLRRGQIVTAEVDRRRCATRRGATTPRRTCCTRRCGRCSARTSSRRARWSRPIGCASTSCTSRRSRATDSSEIERIVNEQIVRNTPVQTEVRSTEEAIAAGAMALFGEKYGDRVRVVSIPGFSVELCGGTHVRATGDIGLFVITEESGVAAGVRRIEALTGAGAVAWIQQQRASARRRARRRCNATPAQARRTVQRLQADSKRLRARSSS